MTTRTTCTCGKPLRDVNTTCDDCTDEYARILRSAEWLDRQLGITAIGFKSPQPSYGKTVSKEHPIPYNEQAFKTHAILRNELVRAVRACQDMHIRGTDPHQGWPDDTVASMAHWLGYRIDQLAQTDWMPDLVVAMISLELDALRVINPPMPRKFLGICTAEIANIACEGPVFALEDLDIGKCRDCNADYDALTSRQGLLDALHERICTASEAVEYAMLLGLHMNRERLQNLIRSWRRPDRRRITVVQHNGEGEEMFRWSEIDALLPKHDTPEDQIAG